MAHCLSSGHRGQLMFQDFVDTERLVGWVVGVVVVIMRRWAEQGFRWILSSWLRWRRLPVG